MDRVLGALLGVPSLVTAADENHRTQFRQDT
jgi:hypothetical protein